MSNGTSDSGEHRIETIDAFLRYVREASPEGVAMVEKLVHAFLQSPKTRARTVSDSDGPKEET
jgi:hypothetical protein